MSCIVVFRQADRVVLAADSLTTHARRDADALTTSRSAGGKIHDCGRWRLASCGFSKGPEGLNVGAAFARALTPTRTLADGVKAVQRTFAATVLPSLSKARRYPLFRELFDAVGGSVLAMLWVGIENGTPVVGSFGVDFDAESGNARMYGGPLPVTHFAIGQQLAIDLTTKPPRPDWLERGDVDAAHRLLTMQIEATPERVTGPIHVVEMCADGRVNRSVS